LESASKVKLKFAISLASCRPTSQLDFNMQVLYRVKICF
jgi:hypothetical protein